jgi:hypothetical protein
MVGDWAEAGEAMVVVPGVPSYSAMAELRSMSESYWDIVCGGSGGVRDGVAAELRCTKVLEYIQRSEK